MNDLYLIGGVGGEITLESVINKVDSSDKNKPLNVHIHSGGGSVFEGLAIYNYFKGLKQEVNTHSAGLVASIASIMFLAGKNRTINSTDNFLIHLPSNIGMGNAADLEKTAKQLREIESKLVGIYVNETNITEAEATDLMTKDDFLDVEFLKEKGFVNDIIEFKAVATIDNNFNNDMSEQLTKKDAENLFEKFGNKLKDIFNPEVNATVNKIVQDATGKEIEFSNLSETDAVLVGEKATIENVKAQGDVLMPKGETYRFDNGILTEIIEAPESEEMTNLKAELLTVTNEVAELKNSIEEKETANATLKESFTNLETEFTELKNTVTSNFEIDNKTEQPKETKTVESRTNFKSKIK